MGLFDNLIRKSDVECNKQQGLINPVVIETPAAYHHQTPSLIPHQESYSQLQEIRSEIANCNAVIANLCNQFYGGDKVEVIPLWMYTKKVDSKMEMI